MESDQISDSEKIEVFHGHDLLVNCIYMKDCLIRDLNRTGL